MRRISHYGNGFTLVELMVVIVILGVLLTGLIIGINPLRQLNKAGDVQRVQDLATIATALDSYYNDTKCYPQSIPFGSQWAVNGQVYLQTVPNDPQATTNGNYAYLTGSSGCSQWNVTFAKLTSVPDHSACSLPTNCLPINYTTNWACNVSGKPDCPTVIAYSLPTVLPTPVYTAGSHTTPTPTPLPSSGGSGQTVSYCHATGIQTWQQINGTTTDALADTDPYDIIPPFDYTCSAGACNFPGKNWNTTTNSIWMANCVNVWNADAAGILHGPDGSWCQNSNTGEGDVIRKISCTDNTGTYYSVCQADSLGGAVLDPGCRAYQVGGNLHKFSVGCLGSGTSQGTAGADLICSNLDNVYPGTNSVCSQGLCTDLPSSVTTAPNNITFRSLPGYGVVNGTIQANTILDIEPSATDPTNLVNIRMLTVSVNGTTICRLLPPQIACIWNVPPSIPANYNNKIDIQITATSGEGVSATQDFYYKLVQ